MSYQGLSTFADVETPHLGGSIKVGDPFTYSPHVWDYVIARYGISTALDLGSGIGNASLYLSNKGVRVLAVDGFRESVDSALYPTLLHDLTKGAVYTRVDLVHCQEVVEHIAQRYIDNLMESLLTGKVILMTHAVPGQGGHHHVNLQSSDYWIDHFERRGCSLQVEDTNRIRALAKAEGAKYLANTGMIFVNNRRI